MPPRRTPPPFPGLTAYDFALFERDKWRSSNYDEGRLALKRKLAAIGKRIDLDFASRGIPLEHKTSVHNPCAFNSGQVRMLKVYFARSKAARAALKSVLGPALSGELDPHYHNLQLWAKVDAGGLELALAVHPQAWWDGQHLVKLVQAREGRLALCAVMNPLTEYGLQVAEYATHPCPGIYADDLARIVKTYRVGDDWLFVRRVLGVEHCVALGPALADEIARELDRLVPLYQRVAWSPEPAPTS